MRPLVPFLLIFLSLTACDNSGVRVNAVEGMSDGDCFDGQDNDGDGLVDCADEGCLDLVECQPEETATAVETEVEEEAEAEEPRIEGTEPGDCNDGADNDADGLFDCNDDGCEGAPDCEETIVTEGLFIEMDKTTITTTPAGGETLQLHAIVKQSDGSEETVQPQWIVSDADIATIDENGLLTPSTEQGGTVDISATYDIWGSTTQVTVQFEAVIIEGDVDPDWFETEATEVADSGITYPEDKTVIPNNTPALTFEWPDYGARGYRIRFTTDILDVSVFTDSTLWTASEDLWSLIGQNNSGLEVNVELSSSQDDGSVHVYNESSLVVQDMEGQGSIIYWTPTIEGLVEIPYGSASQTFFASGRCVGCHAVSSQGVMAFNYDSGLGEFGMKNLSNMSDITTANSMSASLKAFSPDGSFLVVINSGQMFLLDGVTGSLINSVDVGGVQVTHPAWSPDDTKLAVVIPASFSSDINFTGGKIAIMEHLGNGIFGQPQIILDLGDETNAYYPTFSPDGQWIAFNVSTEDSYDDTTAEVWVMTSTGGNPIRLDLANQATNLANSWPQWAPGSINSPFYWLTFSSRRNFGNNTSGNPQIWVTGFDKNLANSGLDPSTPAFWLPNQDPAQNNHLPVWVP